MLLAARENILNVKNKITRGNECNLSKTSNNNTRIRRIRIEKVVLFFLFFTEQIIIRHITLYIGI